MAVKSTAHTATHTRTGYNSIQLLTNLLDLKKNACRGRTCTLPKGYRKSVVNGGGGDTLGIESKEILYGEKSRGSTTTLHFHLSESERGEEIKGRMEK